MARRSARSGNRSTVQPKFLAVIEDTLSMRIRASTARDEGPSNIFQRSVSSTTTTSKDCVLSKLFVENQRFIVHLIRCAALSATYYRVATLKLKLKRNG